MPSGAVLTRLNQLFDGRTVAGLTEAQLLERYLARRDEVAFEALVARHGPMVLGVCRRVLRDPDAVEDAFQATFLVLVRKAGAIRQRDLLGPWLHAVATKTAHRARANAARRRSVEGQGPAPEPIDPGCHPAHTDDLAEIRGVLDEEVARLPEKYRAPVVLCYFQHQTHDEAAERLGWPVGTVRGRLARARDRLRGRLTRRGLAPASALSAAVLAREAAGSLVPQALASTTLRAVVAAGSGAWLGSVSLSAFLLSREIARSLLMTRVTIGAAVALTAAGLVTAGATVQAFQRNRPPSAEVAALPMPEGIPVAADEPPPGDAEIAAVETLVDDGLPRPPIVDGDLAPTPEPPPPRDDEPGNGAAQVPPAPPNFHYEMANLPPGPAGRARLAYVLVPDELPSHEVSEPLEPLPHRPAPQPQPLPEPEAPTELLEPPHPEPDIAQVGPEALDDVTGYLNETQQKVEQSIQVLTRSQSSMRERLAQSDRDLNRLRALRSALAGPEPALMPPPINHEGPLDLRPLDSSGIEEIKPTAFRPDPVPPNPYITDSAPSPSQRIEGLESKLDRLILSIESLKGEVESIKQRGNESADSLSEPKPVDER